MPRLFEAHLPEMHGAFRCLAKGKQLCLIRVPLPLWLVPTTPAVACCRKPAGTASRFEETAKQLREGKGKQALTEVTLRR